MTEPPKFGPPPIRALTCCCCGGPTRGRQWWNRDAGFGLCDRCVSLCSRGETADSFASLYGQRGVHYGLTLEPAPALTVERAREIVKAGSAFMNYTRHMTPAEEAFIRAVWMADPDGSSSFGSTLRAYACLAAWPPYAEEI